MVRLTQVQRGHAIASLLKGQQQQQVARQFRVNISILERFVRRQRETGTVADRPRSGRPRVTTPRQDRNIRLAHLRNRHLTATKMAINILIKEGISSGKLPDILMSMHNNFYWYHMMVEDNRYGQPCCECALIPLRAYIYRIILPRHEHHVNEHGRSPYKRFRKAWKYAADDGLAPPLDKIQPDNIFRNLNTFHAIMCHQERGNFTPNWFDMYGRKNGFTIHLLRYFLLLNWGRNLHLSDQEYLALVAMVMGKKDERYYQTICLKPTVRCVTILNWFQDLYRHAYSMLGSLLHCKHEFPLPSELFSGAMWAAMYMAWQDEIPMAVLKQEMNDIIWEKRHIIRDIVGGLFPFDDR